MNFKKGSEITKDNLYKENKKSLKIIHNLPTNLTSTAMLDIDIQTNIREAMEYEEKLARENS